MLSVCYLYVIFMFFIMLISICSSCYLYVIFMLSLCSSLTFNFRSLYVLLYVIFMLFYVIFMFFFMLSLCYLYVIFIFFMLSVCYLYVIFMFMLSLCYLYYLYVLQNKLIVGNKFHTVNITLRHHLRWYHTLQVKFDHFFIFLAVCLNISIVINIKILANSNQQTQSYKFTSHIAVFLSVVLITEMLEICIQTSYDQNVQLILKSCLPVVYGTTLSPQPSL